MAKTPNQRKTDLINEVEEHTNGKAKFLKFNEYVDGRYILWYYTVLKTGKMSHGALIEEKKKEICYAG